MKVKITITFEMKAEIFPETYCGETETEEEMKERFSNWICEDIYERLESRAQNICLNDYVSKCTVQYEDGSKDSWITG